MAPGSRLSRCSRRIPDGTAGAGWTGTPATVLRGGMEPRPDPSCGLAPGQGGATPRPLSMGPGRAFDSVTPPSSGLSRGLRARPTPRPPRAGARSRRPPVGETSRSGGSATIPSTGFAARPPPSSTSASEEPFPRESALEPTAAILADRFLDKLTAVRCKIRTNTNYRLTIRHQAFSALGEKSLKGLGPEDMTVLFHELQDKHPAADQTPPGSR